MVEAEKRAHKAMLLRAFDCIEALVNQATKAMLLAANAALQPALGLLPSRKPLPRRGRPLGTETVLSLEQIGDANHICALELETPPWRPQVAKKLRVSDSTLYP